MHLTHPLKKEFFFYKIYYKKWRQKGKWSGISTRTPGSDPQLLHLLYWIWNDRGVCVQCCLWPAEVSRHGVLALCAACFFFLVTLSSCVAFFWQVSVGHRKKRVEAVEEKILCARSGMQTGKMMVLQKQESVPGSHEAFSDLYVGSRPRLIWPLFNISTHFTSCLHLLLKWKFNLKIHHLFVNRFIKNALEFPRTLNVNYRKLV